VKALTREEILELPPVIDLPTAGRAFGLGRTFAYELARKDAFPCPVHRRGRLYRVNTSEVIAALGLHRT
jgi:predicted DNA-binding transcriptional regulator AlpA